MAGFLNIETGALVAPAEPLFIGEIDEIDLPTGSEGEEVYATVLCVSSQELTRASMLTSSDGAQRVRDPADAFFADAASVGDWQLWWGQAKQAIAADTVSQRNADAAARIRTIG